MHITACWIKTCWFSIIYKDAVKKRKKPWTMMSLYFTLNTAQAGQQHFYLKTVGKIDWQLKAPPYTVHNIYSASTAQNNRIYQPSSLIGQLTKFCFHYFKHNYIYIFFFFMFCTCQFRKVKPPRGLLETFRDASFFFWLLGSTGFALIVSLWVLWDFGVGEKKKCLKADWSRQLWPMTPTDSWILLFQGQFFFFLTSSLEM